MNPHRITRRRAGRHGGPTRLARLQAPYAGGPRKFKIGACDWSIQKRGDPEALKTAKEIGLDGVEVSFGRPGEKFDLRLAENRAAYLAEAKNQGVEIASLAMGILNQVPYASDDGAEQWVAECIDVMPQLNQQVVLLAFFGNATSGSSRTAAGDRPAAEPRCPRAEAAGVTLGIESYLNADEHLRILDAVGSPSVQVYFDVANMDEMATTFAGRSADSAASDLPDSLQGKRFPARGRKSRFAKVRQTLDEIGWQGWLVIEGALPGGQPMFESYVKNQRFLRRVFAQPERKRPCFRKRGAWPRWEACLPSGIGPRPCVSYRRARFVDMDRERFEPVDESIRFDLQEPVAGLFCQTCGSGRPASPSAGPREAGPSERHFLAPSPSLTAKM